MFNSPRPAQRYGSSNGFGGSYVDEDPLAGSTYDGLDPWSTAPSPSPPVPSTTVFSSVIADATVPSIYDRAFASVDPTNSGETSVNSLSRVLSTSSLPAGTIDRIVSLVSTRPRVSKLEFFVALALVALAQAGKDVSIEQVAALSSQNTLPEPSLDLDTLQPSAFRPGTNFRQNTITADDPWKIGGGIVTGPSNMSGFDSARMNGVPSTLAGSGLPKEWWKRQDSVTVTILGQQGFILNRYMVYQVSSDRGPAVARRYSEFVFLWDVLTRRYPFRLFPALPPKRIGPDEYFLEQRRRGLARSLNYVINHPIIKEDGVLAVFLTEPSLEEWRKHNSMVLDEESASKRVDKVEEMAIPSDLEDKIAIVRGKVNPLIEQWQRICILAERIIKRREAAAVRMPAFRRTYHSAHAALPFSSSSAPVSPTSSSNRAVNSLLTTIFSLPPAFGDTQQGDLARLTNTVRAVVEVNENCWRGDECDLSSGVKAGLEQAAAHFQRHAELSELRTRVLFDTTLEALKSQRDLYIAVRDLLIRYDRLSIDQVERLKKRAETNLLKMEGVRAAQKDSWQEDVDRISGLIEKDQATIAAQLNRRVFIRACMWHELRAVLHNRENTLVTVLVQNFAREEQEFAESVLGNWVSLGEGVEGMPFE
ncbi:hypothetical protein EV421DRAFT_2079379 [Armillaria borealis]|uniref:Sorting nexin MVP1 n=1 Tax=Armillaria borealis TaxID=47425 RepID=A0AA39JUB7_9AGAR|nr:hypothetical protein EV421DRAFT_2079379 [Armillaria borealis]